MAILCGQEYTEIVPNLFLAGDYEPQSTNYLNNRSDRDTFDLVVRCGETTTKNTAIGSPENWIFEPKDNGDGRVCVGVHCFDLDASGDLLNMKACVVAVKDALEAGKKVLVHCQQA